MSLIRFNLRFLVFLVLQRKVNCGGFFQNILHVRLFQKPANSSPARYQNRRRRHSMGPIPIHNRQGVRTPFHNPQCTIRRPHRIAASPKGRECLVGVPDVYLRDLLFTVTGQNRLNKPDCHKPQSPVAVPPAEGRSRNTLVIHEAQESGALRVSDGGPADASAFQILQYRIRITTDRR